MSRVLGSCCLTGTMRGSGWLVLALLVVGCTALRKPVLKPVEVQVEADLEVQAELDDVAVTVETLDPKSGGWSTLATRRFTPHASEDWPLSLSLEQQDARLVYQVTATARDTRQAVLARARVIADPKERSTDRVRVRIDRECLRRAQLCPSGETCALGACVDARLPLPLRKAAADGADAAVPAADGGVLAGAVALAKAGESCGRDGAHACAARASRTPLSCVGGQWQPQPECAADERCDSTNGPSLGECLPIAEECKDREPGASFCDATGQMRACMDLVSSELRPCGDNEQCADAEGGVRCACKPGFVDRGSGCRAGTDCGEGAGGCDPLTQCEMVAGKPSCTACPPGHDGDGKTGCAPRLLELRPERGQLAPVFSPEQHAYTLRLPLLAQRVSLSATAVSGARVTIDGRELTAGQRWTSNVLPLGETQIDLNVLSRAGVPSRYQLQVQRTGAETGYLKPKAASSGDLFGSSVAAEGGRLLIGAPYEDSCATGVNGNAADEGCPDSGAAYLFEREAGRWVQRAYFKPSEARAGQLFGTSVAISGDVIAVGALGDDIFKPAPVHNGAVYLFVPSGDSWKADQTLTPTESAAGDAFGLQLSLTREHLAVGAPLTDVGSQNAGSVFVFTRQGNTWQQQQRLQADKPGAEARFGSCLALDGEALFVGAPQDPRSMTRGGAVYAFEPQPGAAQMRFVQRLEAPVVRANQQFGFALAAQGGVVVVGAPHNGIDLGTPHSGALHVYARQNGSYARVRSLEASRPRNADFFGTSVALSANALLVGASGDASPAHGLDSDGSLDGCEFCGAAYLYARKPEDPTAFDLSTYIKASNSALHDGFGTAVALTDELAVVTSNFEDATDDSQADSGAAYVFE